MCGCLPWCSPGNGIQYSIRVNASGLHPKLDGVYIHRYGSVFDSDSGNIYEHNRIVLVKEDAEEKYCIWWHKQYRLMKDSSDNYTRISS